MVGGWLGIVISSPSLRVPLTSSVASVAVDTPILLISSPAVFCRWPEDVPEYPCVNGGWAHSRAVSEYCEFVGEHGFAERRIKENPKDYCVSLRRIRCRICVQERKRLKLLCSAFEDHHDMNNPEHIAELKEMRRLDATRHARHPPPAAHRPLHATNQPPATCIASYLRENGIRLTVLGSIIWMRNTHGW